MIKLEYFRKPMMFSLAIQQLLRVFQCKIYYY